jgi:hypothetical protein
MAKTRPLINIPHHRISLELKSVVTSTEMIQVRDSSDYINILDLSKNHDQT